MRNRWRWIPAVAGTSLFENAQSAVPVVPGARLSALRFDIATRARTTDLDAVYLDRALAAKPVPSDALQLFIGAH